MLYKSARLVGIEEMDELSLSRQELRAALQGLSVINCFSLTAHSVWDALERFAKKHNLQELKVLDMGCGRGDLLLSLEETARARKFQFKGLGLDNNPKTVRSAKALARLKNSNILFAPWDASSDPFPPGFDVAVSSLFLHHLSDSQALNLMKRICARRFGLCLISDLLRSSMAKGAAFCGSRILSRSKIVHRDAVRSVDAAFTFAELRALCVSAGINQFRIKPVYPWRFMLAVEQ